MQCPICQSESLTETQDGLECAECGVSDQGSIIPVSALSPEARQELFGAG
jgi:transcription initiation factor TFIIIB Brf1 subunit/transcription initiation factor TFIIB